MDRGFRWLHLSDLHAGMSGLDWMWPTFKTVFLEDLKRLYDKTGAWDLVVFSGDLAQIGAKGDYDKVIEALADIWFVQEELGFKPPLAAVPGNHDLSRPDQLKPELIVMNDWWNYEEVRLKGLTDPDSAYRKLLEEAFAGYSQWKVAASNAGLPFLAERPGLLPGDFSATLRTAEGELGILGLNSSWLQLGQGDYKGKLSVEVKQLLALTDDDPDAWRRKHSRNILITHHPEDWLHPSARGVWQSEINPPGRFDAHLYGHMHQPNVTSISLGGSHARRSIQAASIFGLEKIDGKLTRINGYSVAALDLDGGLRVWPRITQKLQSGSWKLVPDQSLDLNNDDSFRIGASGASPALARGTSVPKIGSSTVVGVDSEQRTAAVRILQSLRYHVPGHMAHRNVRRIEQGSAVAALADARAVWLSADWGAGSNGFIKSIAETTLSVTPTIYKLDIVDYVSREAFLDNFKSSMGVSLEQLCADLAGEGAALLILDNCPTSAGAVQPGTMSPEADIESIVEAILNFCPDLRVVLRSRRAPQSPRYAWLSLQALDEADVRAYVLDHEKGGNQYRSAKDISAIYRHSDGSPERIDATLRDLEIVAVGQLSTTNSDLMLVGPQSAAVPAGLRRAIDDLAASKDPDQQRAYALLKALVAFPLGESIVHIRRFYDAQAIYPGHARELIDTSLVVSVIPVGTQVGGQSDAARLLFVPRPVRDYVRTKMSQREQGKLTNAAAKIYFGDNWMLGTLKKSVAEKFSQPSVASHETGNASSIILRLLNEALDEKDERSVEAALNIAKAYLNPLFRGDHFRNVVTLAEDLLARLPDNQAEAEAFLKYQLGRALRMSGKNGEAGETLSTVDSTLLPAAMKRTLLLTQALNLQRQGDSAGAVMLAKKLLPAGRRSASALHARAIILQEDPDTTADQLRALERTCRKNDAQVVANNLAFSRAERDSTTPEEARQALDEIIKGKDKDDYYNKVRAIINKVRLRNSLAEPVDDAEKSMLIDAYHFLYNERLPALFDQCHSVLWDLFIRENDQEHLLRLFRHSSLIWRLRGEDNLERRYLKRLAEQAQNPPVARHPSAEPRNCILSRPRQRRASMTTVWVWRRFLIGR